MELTKEQIAYIKTHPDFVLMEKKKSRLSMTFSAMTLAMYFTYICYIGINPHAFGAPMWSGSTTTWGIFWGVCVILFSIIVTGIYVYKANGEFDRLTQKVVNDLAS